jgi:hypothetical protein
MVAKLASSDGIISNVSFDCLAKHEFHRFVVVSVSFVCCNFRRDADCMMNLIQSIRGIVERMVPSVELEHLFMCLGASDLIVR